MWYALCVYTCIFIVNDLCPFVLATRPPLSHATTVILQSHNNILIWQQVAIMTAGRIKQPESTCTHTYTHTVIQHNTVIHNSYIHTYYVHIRKCCGCKQLMYNVVLWECAWWNEKNVWDVEFETMRVLNTHSCWQGSQL